ncbi:MAG: class B sortase, partial [bacterium]|nr:class B sortase [bacterium]
NKEKFNETIANSNKIQYNERNTLKKRWKLMKWIDLYKRIPAVHKVVLCIAICILAGASVLLVRSLAEYRNARVEYKKLQTYTTNKSEAEQEDRNTSNHTSLSSDTNDGQEQLTGYLSEERNEYQAKPVNPDEKNLSALNPDEKDFPVLNPDRKDFPALNPDFCELAKINSDLVAWLYIEVIDLSYPVVQGEDNEYYLTHTFEDQKNASGCIFMDSEQDPNLSDYNTFIYGHNMKDGSMFGSLKKLLYMDDFTQKAPYFYLYTKEGIYQYRIYSCYQDTPNSKSFWKCKTKEEYQQYRNAALDKSSVEAAADEMKHLLNAETGYEACSVVLVTCTGEGASTQRLFVHGQLECMYQEQ